MQNCFVFFCDGNHSPSSNECPRKKFERGVIETENVERISIESAKRQVMGAKRSENSSYAAAIKKIKHVKRKVVVDRVNPLKNVNQSRSKADVELSAVGVGLSAAEVGPSAAEAELSAMEVELSAAKAALSTGEVVLSAVEVGVSAAKLVSSPRSKSHHLRKSSCLLQNSKLLEPHNPLVWQPVNLLQQRPLLPLPQVLPKQSLSQNPGALHLRDCSGLYLLWWRYIDLRI